MNEKSSISEPVWTLINEFLDQTISDEGIAQLEQALSNNPAAQLEFFHYTQLHMNLDTDVRSQRVISSFIENKKSSSPASLVGIPNLAEIGVAHSLSGESNSPVLGNHSVGPLPTASLSSVRYFNIGLGMLAALVVGVLIWSPWKPLKSIRLASGSVNVTVANVGTIVVEAVNGPAAFDLISPMRARLLRGRIHMQVSQETGKGFVIETPGGEVTDLGTEFVLDVTGEKKSELLVLSGAVDLRLKQPKSADPPQSKRFEVGEGVAYGENGELQRVNSIIRGEMTQTYLHSNETTDRKFNPVIVKVTDNLATKKFYEIIPGGLKEDASRCVDREEAEWNGATPEGMPSYLVGADYVKNFANDLKNEKLEIKVTLERPAKLYIFYSDLLKPPKWLTSNFRKTGDIIGSDAGKMSHSKLGVGPGVSINDTYDIWEQIVTEPKTVTLGAVKPTIDPKTGQKKFFAIYGIAAIPLEKKTADIAISHEQEPDQHFFDIH